MKLLELEIENMRGIRHVELSPRGGNLVVYGPNGSGKSAVIDAIDFLLTGRITRLTGKGTGGISLHDHGPHIDHEPEEASVRGVFEVPGVKKPVEIRRCMADPGNLDCDGSVEGALEPITSLAARGQHILTRRDILRYITAEAATRARQIQELLNISEVEDIRKSFVTVGNTLAKERNSAQRAVKKAREAVNLTTGEESFDEQIVLEAVNANRAVLGGDAIGTLLSGELKGGLPAPVAQPGGDRVSPAILDKSIQAILDVMSEHNQTQIAEADRRIRKLIEEIRSEPEMVRALALLELTALGMTLIDETGSCPLCDTAWPPGKLREYLDQRLSRAQVASDLQKRVAELRGSITSNLDGAVAGVKDVMEAAQRMGAEDEAERLESWLDDLEELSSALEDPLENYPSPRFGSDDVAGMLAPADLGDDLQRVRSLVKERYPEATPEQEAWDTLTRLEENLKVLEGAQTELEQAERAHRRAPWLLDTFVAARDAVLGKLYDQVKDRFVQLYCLIHGSDEKGFTAKIEPDDAGLALEVDFYGRGTHPPHALHSEGHQDSMGLCLYLALADQLTKGVIDLVMLDDVVMSVDSGHRREVCRLLGTCFPDRQFVITTHDKTWANELRAEGIVDKGGIVEFYNWDVSTGPVVNYEVDMWRRIEEDLRANRVSSAASDVYKRQDPLLCASTYPLRS